MNRAQRRATVRSERRTARAAVALGSTAVLATAGAGAAVVLSSAPAGANATIVVDSLTDDGTGTTLRDAIVAANAAPGEDEITFSVTGTITLTSDLTHITDALHIHGPGEANLTIDGDGSYSVLVFDHIDSADGTNEVTHLTITGGNSSNNHDESGGAIQLYYGTSDFLAQNVTFDHNYSGNDGGAFQIFKNTGDVTLDHVTATDNWAYDSGGVLYTTSQGTGTLTITNSRFEGNHLLYGNGGAVWLYQTDTTIINTVISGNNADDGYGGGLYASVESDLTIVGSTIDGNEALYGGGGINTDDTSGLVLLDSTVSNNVAGFLGGGLYLGGAPAQIVQSTISGNTADQAGGIYVADGSGLAVLLSTITDNTTTGVYSDVGGIQVEGTGTGSVRSEHRAAHADSSGRRGDGEHEKGVHTSDDPVPTGTVLLIGTIAAANDGVDIGAYGSTEVDVQSLGSIIGTIDTGQVTVTDVGGTQSGVTAAALKLGPLADNGGPTQTHALLSGSVAIDAGPATADLPDFPGSAYDQRGEPYTRIINGKVDVGAYEAQPEATPEPEPTFTG